MSATTTTTASGNATASAPPPTSRVLRLRGDELVREHSAAQQEAASAGDDQDRRADREYPPSYEGPDPVGWPAGRGVPHYRPLRRNEAETRPLGATTDQRVFVTLMMSGVFVLGRVHGMWASTLGRVANVWEYPIGGQF